MIGIVVMGYTGLNSQLELCIVYIIVRAFQSQQPFNPAHGWAMKNTIVNFVCLVALYYPTS